MGACEAGLNPHGRALVAAVVVAIKGLGDQVPTVNDAELVCLLKFCQLGETVRAITTGVVGAGVGAQTTNGNSELRFERSARELRCQHLPMRVEHWVVLSEIDEV